MRSIRKQLKDLNANVGSLERQELLVQNVKNAIKGVLITGIKGVWWPGKIGIKVTQAGQHFMIIECFSFFKKNWYRRWNWIGLGQNLFEVEWFVVGTYSSSPHLVIDIDEELCQKYSYKTEKVM